MKQSRKKAIAAAPKYGLHIEGLGWLANSDYQDMSDPSSIVFTEHKELAMEFAEGFDNPVIKVGIWNVPLHRTIGKDFTLEPVYL